MTPCLPTHRWQGPETPKLPKFQPSVQKLGYHVDSVHSGMPTPVSVAACVRPALDPGWSRWQGGKETFPDKLLPQRKPRKKKVQLKVLGKRLPAGPPAPLSSRPQAVNSAVLGKVKKKNKYIRGDRK